MAGVLFVGWDGFCLYDLARAKEARFLPKSVWAIITLISFPFGGILYMLIGRDWDRLADARRGGELLQRRVHARGNLRRGGGAGGRRAAHHRLGH
jgi:hypothetical protein